MAIAIENPDVDSDEDTVSWAAITRAAGFDAFVATPSSANLKTLVTDETGSGALVFATSPTLAGTIAGTPTVASAWTWSAAQSFPGGTFTGDVTINSTGPNVYLYESDAAANNRYWRMLAQGEDLFLGAVNDALSSAGYWCTVSRTGVTIDSIALAATAITANGSDVVTLSASQTLTNKTLTSPTLTTPSLGVATATSINKVAITAPATGATLTIPDGLTLNAGPGGTLTAVAFAATGQFPATATNDDAGAGKQGEYSTASRATGSALGLTTATQTDIASLSLTAGDWDVWLHPKFTPAAGTNVTRLAASLSTTTATLDAALDRFVDRQYGGGIVLTAGGSESLPLGPARFSLSGTTTIYAVVFAAFTVSTLTAFGIIRARRVR